MTSYQKLKKELKEQKELINKLQNAIADNDAEIIMQVKQLVWIERNMEKMVWFGGTKTEQRLENDLTFYGNAYIEKIKNKQGKTISIKRVDPTRVIIKNSKYSINNEKGDIYRYHG